MFLLSQSKPLTCLFFVNKFTSSNWYFKSRFCELKSRICKFLWKKIANDDNDRDAFTNPKFQFVKPGFDIPIAGFEFIL